MFKTPQLNYLSLVTDVGNTPDISEKNIRILQAALKHENQAGETMNHRLQELIKETEMAFAKLKDGCALSGDLKGTWVIINRFFSHA